MRSTKHNVLKSYFFDTNYYSSINRNIPFIPTQFLSQTSFCATTIEIPILIPPLCFELLILLGNALT